MKFVHKVFKKGEEVLLTATDKELLDKTIEDEDFVFHIDKNFYGDEEIDEEIIEKFREATSINIIGENIIALAVKEGLIDRENVLLIKGVPHAICVKV